LRLGRAVELASQSGHDAVGRLLARVVEVVDTETGIVRIKEDVDASDEMALDTRSTRSVRAGVPTGGRGSFESQGAQTRGSGLTMRMGTDSKCSSTPVSSP
jgi:hypothetical protein